MTIKRAIERSKLDRKTNIDLVDTMWSQFNFLNEYECYTLKTTDLSVDETVLIIGETVRKKTNLLV